MSAAGAGEINVLGAGSTGAGSGVVGLGRGGLASPLAWMPDFAHSRASASERFSTCVSWARPPRTTDVLTQLSGLRPVGLLHGDFREVEPHRHGTTFRQVAPGVLGGQRTGEVPP